MVADSEESFFALKDTWQDIRRRSVSASASSDWTWLIHWWKGFCGPDGGGKTNRPYIVTVFEGDVPVAIYPFFESERRGLSLEPKRLRQLGYAGELDPASLTEEPLAVVVAGFEPMAERAISAHLAAGLRSGRWDCVSFRALASEGLRSESGLRFGVAYVAKSKQGVRLAPLPETWTAFRASLSKSMRDNLAYYPRLLGREGHSFSVHLCQDAEAVRRAVPHLIDLHRTRAHFDGGGQRDDHIPTEVQAQMLRQSLPALAEEGRAMIGTLEVDGVIVAAQAFLCSDRQLLIHYSGFDPSYGRYSPLLVIQAEVLKWAIHQGICEMNVLLGDAAWQKRWNAEPSQCIRQCRMASLRPSSVIRWTLYAIRRELACRQRRERFSLCLLSIRQTISSGLTGGYEMHSKIARVLSSPMAHHMVRFHR